MINLLSNKTEETFSSTPLADYLFVKKPQITTVQIIFVNEVKDVTHYFKLTDYERFLELRLPGSKIKNLSVPSRPNYDENYLEF